jgi:tetratricopeptide (TPR) repeat protein
VSIAITEEVSAHVGPDIRGVLLVLAEAYQAQGQWSEAIACLERLRKLEPEDDVVVKLSLAELLIETGPQKRSPYQEVVQFTEGIANESPVHAALLMYKAKALRGLGLREAALEVLSGLLRKRKYPEELLRALRYEQAVLYEEGGQEQRARAEWEKLYAEAPDYEDVAVRLGM